MFPFIGMGGSGSGSGGMGQGNMGSGNMNMGSGSGMQNALSLGGMNPSMGGLGGMNPTMQALQNMNPTMQALYQQYAIRWAAMQKFAQAAQAASAGMGGMATPAASSAMGARSGMGGSAPGPRQGPPPQGPPQDQSQDPGVFYKTRICNKWREGHCPFGDTCKYAHGEHELRHMNDNLREGIGRDAPAPRSHAPSHAGPSSSMRDHRSGSGDHHRDSRDSRDRGGSSERERGDAHKTRLCSEFMNTGRCRYGSTCTFAHGQHELRQPGGSMPPPGMDRRAPPQVRLHSWLAPSYLLSFSPSFAISTFLCLVAVIANVVADAWLFSACFLLPGLKGKSHEQRAPASSPCSPIQMLVCCL